MFINSLKCLQFHFGLIVGVIHQLCCLLLCWSMCFSIFNFVSFQIQHFVSSRYARVLIPHSHKHGAVPASVKLARLYLSYKCKEILGKKGKNELADQIYTTCRTQMCRVNPVIPLENIPTQKPTDGCLPMDLQFDLIELMNSVLSERQTDNVRVFLMQLVQNKFPISTITEVARFVHLMCGDAALSVVLPFRYHGQILECCDSIQEGDLRQEQVIQLSHFNCDLGKMLAAVASEGSGVSLCVSFLLDLLDLITKTHENDHDTLPVEEMQGSYNPPSGTCYYFTRSGNQIRKMPLYDLESGGKNHDNAPVVDEACNKMFPQVAYRGFGYILLIFCPVHGHCYGFHLIHGGEGRKDPFAALYKYLPDPPDEFFYDFACSLSEYSLNREPKHFKETRFWGDVWHQTTNHKCGSAFQSDRIPSIKGVNTEICEQFNAFIQCIKYTGSHLSQIHFMLFMQFMIYIFNSRKTVRFKDIASIAVAGME